VLTLSPWREHQIPQVKGPAPYFRLSPVLLAHWLEIRGLHNPLFMFDDFLEQLVELRKTIYLVDY